jgi:hypothetical protein
MRRGSSSSTLDALLCRHQLWGCAVQSLFIVITLMTSGLMPGGLRLLSRYHRCLFLIMIKLLDFSSTHHAARAERVVARVPVH